AVAGTEPGCWFEVEAVHEHRSAVCECVGRPLPCRRTVNGVTQAFAWRSARHPWKGGHLMLRVSDQYIGPAACFAQCRLPVDVYDVPVCYRAKKRAVGTFGLQGFDECRRLLRGQ